MDESEKLTALKKAYAEIILNTAKEAAARIMVSERKSLHYQRELSTAKDCALQMLLRLKHMMDSTVSEAEKTSLTQRKKIEELEAQLEEAEDIVKDLRDELHQVHDKLERVKNNKLQAAMEQNLVGKKVFQIDITPEDGLDPTGSMSPFPCPEPTPILAYETTESIFPLPCSKPEMVSTYKMHSTLNGSDFHTDGGYLCDSDFASVRRSKEPELYRNGCTQRIRAFERNTIDESLSFSGKDDIKSGIIYKGDEEAKELQLTQSHISENPTEDGQKVDITAVGLMDCSNIIGAHVLKPCRRKRKREVKYNKGKAPSVIYIPDVPKTDPYRSDGDDASETADIMTSLEEDGMERDEAFVKPCNALIMIDDKKEVLDKPDLICQDNFSLVSSYEQGCKTDVETVEELLASPDKKESDMNDEKQMELSPSSNKLLKYTFQRKRKKEHLNSPNGSSSIDEGVLDKEIRKSQSTSLGSQKLSSMPESP